MIVPVALLLAADTLPAPPPPSAEDQIVIMGQRIRSIEVNVGQDQTGTWHCSLSDSSGNARVDERLCRTSTTCAQRHGNDREALLECIESRRPGILEDFRQSLRRSRNR